MPSTLKVIVPVGVPLPEPGLTVASKITLSPALEGFGLAATVVVVVTLSTVWTTKSDVAE